MQSLEDQTQCTKAQWEKKLITWKIWSLPKKWGGNNFVEHLFLTSRRGENLEGSNIFV